MKHSSMQKFTYNILIKLAALFMIIINLSLTLSIRIPDKEKK